MSPEERRAFEDAMLAEFERIGLDWRELGGMAMSGEQSDRILSHLRSLPAGSSWHDVFPDLPVDWTPASEGTERTRYHPLGSYDYQELPTGAAIHVSWERNADPGSLEALVADARALGFSIHGAGFHDSPNPEYPSIDAFIVLARESSDQDLYEFCNWLEWRTDVKLAGLDLRMEQEYLG